MKLIKNQDGKININATLAALEAGESISLNETEVNVNYVRVTACKLSRQYGRTIEVANGRDLGGMVIIRRTA